METIILPSGQEVFLDKEDYERLKGFRYYLHKKGYAYRFTEESGKRKAVYLHHDVIGKQNGKVVDHINGIKLDNRRTNLRHITNRENILKANKTRTKGSSGYKGVSWNKTANAWSVNIVSSKKRYHIGFFQDEKVAAYAYNHSAKEMFGEFAYENDVPECDWESHKIPNRKDGTGKSKYRGVSLVSGNNKWRVSIMYNHEYLYLGCYEDEIEAAKVYNQAAIKYKGDKAKLNIISY